MRATPCRPSVKIPRPAAGPGTGARQHRKRDGQLERLLHKQATRFTSLLYVAIFLSIAALVAVAILMVQLMNKPTGPTPSTTAPVDVRGAM